MRFFGIDGIRNAWLVAEKVGSQVTLRRLERFSQLLSSLSDSDIAAVDMPIGLLDAAQARGRECEKIAREKIGKRSSSVFSSPTRISLAALDYPAAVLANRKSSPAALGLSKQSFAIFPKLREIDGCLNRELQKRVREVHPELCFAVLRDELALSNSHFEVIEKKSSVRGVEQRSELLRLAGYSKIDELIASRRKHGAEIDDVLDACVAAWTAERKAKGMAICFPSSPPIDSRGLRMEMWA